jgi:hypothetical protein
MRDLFPARRYIGTITFQPADDDFPMFVRWFKDASCR